MLKRLFWRTLTIAALLVVMAVSGCTTRLVSDLTTPSRAFQPVDGYNPIDEIRNTRYFDDHASRFFASRSPAETLAIQRQTDWEDAHRELIETAVAATAYVAVLLLLLLAGFIGAKASYARLKPSPVGIMARGAFKLSMRKLRAVKEALYREADR
jgi:hypothetical protein